MHSSKNMSSTMETVGFSLEYADVFQYKMKAWTLNLSIYSEDDFVTVNVWLFPWLFMN